MINYIVTQGEWAVIGPSSKYTSIGTFAAAPCVILGINDGFHCALMHIHEGNTLESVTGALKGFVEASNKIDYKRIIKAYISTDTSVKACHKKKQDFIVKFARYALGRVKVQAFVYLGSSAAVISKNSFIEMRDEKFILCACGAALNHSFERAKIIDRKLLLGGVAITEYKP